MTQGVDLIAMSHVNLKNFIAEKLMKNPALEESPPGAIDHVEQTGSQPVLEKLYNRALDWYEYLGYNPNSLEVHLMRQLDAMADERANYIGHHIIENLDDDGYLSLSLDEVCKSAGATVAEVEAERKMILFLDPVGVAARDLQECLWAQLKHSETGSSLAATIVIDCFADLQSERYDKLAATLGTTIDEIQKAAKVIGSLERTPSRGFEREVRDASPDAMSDAAELIAPTTPMDSQFSKQEDVFTADPDVFVERIRGEWIIALNIDGVPRLRLNPFYLRMVDQEGASDKKPRQYLYGNVRSAAFLIEDIEQRAQMLAGVVGSIIKFQSEFLEHGVSHLKPLMLRDVADVIRSDESTVRRIVANKHVHTPQGLFALRFFFNANIVADPSNAGKRY